MSDDVPDWLPTIEDDEDPKPQQQTIIESERYPMRVLAGAGTGKTFTMVRKIENLIDEHGVSPDRILALTFTNNAADSMREKLNAKLGPAGYDVDAYTYHSICNEILTDYAYDVGLDPDFEIATDAEKYVIVLDVLDEIDYRAVKPNVYGPDSYVSGVASKLLSFIGSMKRSGISPAEIEEYLGSPEQVYELDAVPDRIEEIASDHLGGRSVSTVLDGIPDTRADLVAERDTLRDEGLEASIKDFLDRLVDLCDALEVAFEEHEAGERSLPEDAHKLPKYLLGGYSSAPSGIPNDLKLELTDYLRNALDECKTALDLNTGYEAYERELDRRNLLDFDGLVVKTVELLETDVGEGLGDRWDYVFCDEFQDTDRLQFDLITSLVSEDRLFVVGDDDQAIYEWRGANVANITDELDDVFGPDLEDEPLEQNFRSRQPILDLANEALDRLADRRSTKTLTRVDEPDFDGDTVAVVEEADDEGDRAEQLVTVTRNLLSGDAEALDRAYDPGEIALLVRNNDHATPILEGFDEAGIPYQVAGDLSTESIGVGTVVAYLKALARPEEDDVSWNRVLTMRYRLTDADLRRVNSHDDGTYAGVCNQPLEVFDEPDRIQEVREHISRLLKLRETASLSHLYRELKRLTNIDWYLSEQERRDLAQLDEIIDQYGNDAVQPPLTPQFIDSLQHYDSLLEESGSAPTSQPELADDAVNVMTIHKSKGLDFPVVLMPRLTADEWEPGSRTYDTFESALSEGPESVFDKDLVAQDANEARRILHVGITRAEEILVLHGSREENDTDDERPVHDAVESILPESVPWRPSNGHLPIWRDLQECLPSNHADWTASLASTVVGDVSGQVTYGSENLSASDGRDRVITFGNKLIEGSIEREPENRRFSIDALTGPMTPNPALQHSYTSLEAYEECPRQHFLDYVVNGFSDYRENGYGGDGISQRIVGLLFHDTAEIAAKEQAAERAEWYAICERLAGQRRATDELPVAKECIDRYFDLDLSGWEIVDAEREFQLEVDGHELVGFIDAVYRTPEGELVVIDYKATERHRDIDENKQLPLYLLACCDLYEEPITRAGYAYVGDIGPKVEARSFDEGELDSVRAAVSTTMDRIKETSFSGYETGEHCRWCQHSSLPCGEEWRQEDGGR
ncbi:ATP-dependent helicase [Natrinema longum]|uniref:ATP-dependent helicase n=1 Tax=Natrinema longum TaxID=370324 RepID=UPI001CCF4326|nr:ATP-dependent DNA helicase [Natrinema longum]MBZ6497155.1 ATP-dependent helicase [Natrinema longum]